MSLFTDIQHRTRDDAGCAVWRFSCSNGHPAMRQDGKAVLVRRAIWQDKHGDIEPGKIIRMTCETIGCVHPDHMQLTTYQRLAKQLGSLGLMSGPVRSAKIAATKRAKYAKLTPDAVQEIRTSEETGRAMAKKFNVDEKHISRIRLNHCWKQFSSPWSGLGAM
jgi:hypothetical protein